MPLMVAVVIIGCGGDDDEYGNERRPPAPINVTAAIDDERVRVSPETFGSAARSTGQLEVDPPEGSYRLSAGAGDIAPAQLAVGERRPSAQDELLQP